MKKTIRAKNVAQKDLLGLSAPLKRTVIRRIAIGTTFAVVTLTPWIVFGCSNKFK